MTSYKFLNESIQDSNFKLKMLGVLEGFNDSISKLESFTDTSEPFCLFLQSKNDFFYFETQDREQPSEDFVYNEETHFYEYYLKNKERFEWKTKKVILPETLFSIVFIPKNEYPVFWKTVLIPYIEALKSYPPFNEVIIEKKYENKDLYINGKEFGDTIYYISDEYAIYIRTLVINYSKYKDTVDDVLLSQKGNQKTGILDELYDPNAFDLSTFCDSITKETENVLKKMIRK